jgi:hypothetical protein
MTETANQRDQRLARLRRELAERLEDPAAAIETLLHELEHGDLLAFEWEGLHVAAERDDKEVELGTAYQQVLTRPRLHRLDPPQRVRVLMHAADFFQGILGDADLAWTFLQRVLRVARGAELIEADLGEHRFLAGQTLSLAELFVGPMVDFAVNAGALEPRSATRQWLAELLERPSFRKTRA